MIAFRYIFAAFLVTTFFTKSEILGAPNAAPKQRSLEEVEAALNEIREKLNGSENSIVQEVSEIVNKMSTSQLEHFLQVNDIVNSLGQNIQVGYQNLSNTQLAEEIEKVVKKNQELLGKNTGGLEELSNMMHILVPPGIFPPNPYSGNSETRNFDPFGLFPPDIPRRNRENENNAPRRQVHVSGPNFQRQQSRSVATDYKRRPKIPVPQSKKTEENEKRTPPRKPTQQQFKSAAAPKTVRSKTINKKGSESKLEEKE